MNKEKLMQILSTITDNLKFLKDILEEKSEMKKNDWLDNL